MSRREFSRVVKAKAFDRAKGKCEGCSARLATGKFAYDHAIPDGLGGEPTLDNCKVLCIACHSVKTTTEDVPRIAKMKRQRDNHIGAISPSKKPIQSRGFAKSEPQNRATRPLSKPPARRYT